MEKCEKPLVSVIVPVYNTAAYLDKCMESVRNQIYTRLEIILVDDGSTDGSGRKCDEYAALDDRIKVIHKQNSGLSGARNTALDVMTGEYVTFVDSDDYIDRRLVGRLLECIVKHNCDIVTGRYVKTATEDEKEDSAALRVLLCPVREAMLRMLYRKGLPGYTPGKMYRAAHFDAVRFPEGELFEDTITTYKIMKLSRKVGIIDNPMYYYRQRRGSIVNLTFQSSRLDEVRHAREILKDTGTDAGLRAAAEAYLFFTLMDNYALVDEKHRKDRLFLEKNIRRYRQRVLRDRQTGVPLRVMALLSCLPGMKPARLAGRLYKYVSQRKIDIRH